MPPTHDSSAPPVIRSEFGRRAPAHYETRTLDPTNLPLGEEDGLYHHYALGGFNKSAREVPEAKREMAVLGETGRIEDEPFVPVPRQLAPLSFDARIFGEFARSSRGCRARVAARPFLPDHRVDQMKVAAR
ncbi:hypothetical protein ACFWP7_05340 [Streptomyces sp. NPDC058470]|uniref:hypothetical protein n=1 Tax=Streptomyces sp. NPDC058470 TaxID=3346515 RepID=UPI00365CD8FA